MKLKKKKQIPFDFVLAELDRLNPHVKPMFGAYGVYIEDKIVFILINREKTHSDNGVWLATSKEHHESLKWDFPSMRSIKVFESPITSWQVLPVEDSSFEASVIKACELVLKGDKRIGKIPKQKKLKKT